MEARGYLGRKGRSKFVELQMQRVDWLALLLCLALWLSIWRLPWPMLNQFAGM